MRLVSITWICENYARSYWIICANIGFVNNCIIRHILECCHVIHIIIIKWLKLLLVLITDIIFCILQLNISPRVCFGMSKLRINFFLHIQVACIVLRGNDTRFPLDFDTFYVRFIGCLYHYFGNFRIALEITLALAFCWTMRR